jgi:hypothetical protein
MIKEKPENLEKPKFMAVPNTTLRHCIKKKTVGKSINRLK